MRPDWNWRGNSMAKTMSVRMDEKNYEFLAGALPKDERRTCPRPCEDSFTRGGSCWRWSDTGIDERLGKAAELAGLPVGRMIEILAEYGVASNLEHEDYRKGLENLRKAW